MPDSELNDVFESGDIKPARVTLFVLSVLILIGLGLLAVFLHRTQRIVAGLGFLFLLGIGLWAMRRRRQREEQSYLEALVRLSELSAAISSKLGSGPEVMDQLARAACDLMGMGSAIVGLADLEHNLLHVVATVGVKSLNLGDYQLEAAPGMKHCLQTGQIVKVEDTENSPKLVNVEEMKRVGVRSMLGLPLRIESRVIGLLVVGDSEPKMIGKSQLQLARLLANQAAVILANHRLYEQMGEAIAVQRRDAESRAVLLRELNHRVKNSLAGIVGLLSVGEPKMPVEAKQWLGRVIERIGNMARTHELLSGGMQTIALDELVRQMLPSFAAIKPPGVRIELDVDGVDVILGTQRAVGLAMVLHELCYNAVEHGAGPDGCITIRARGVEGGKVAVEVMDDGSGKKPDESAQQSGGLGLMLVRGLVSRELHGDFTLCDRADGGIMAKVEFSLHQDELDGVGF